MYEYEELQDVTPVETPIKEELEKWQEWCAAALGYCIASKQCAFADAVIDLYREKKEILWELCHDRSSYKESVFTSPTGCLEQEMRAKRMFSVFYAAFYMEDVREKLLKIIGDNDQTLKKFIKTQKMSILNDWIWTYRKRKNLRASQELYDLGMATFAFLLVFQERLVNEWDSLPEGAKNYLDIIRSMNRQYPLDSKLSMGNTFEMVEKMIENKPKNLIEKVGLSEGAWSLIQNIRTVDDVTVLSYILDYYNSGEKDEDVLRHYDNDNLVRAFCQMADISSENVCELREACESEAYLRYATIKSKLMINGLYRDRILTKSDHLNVLMLIYLAKTNPHMALTFGHLKDCDKDQVPAESKHTSLSMYLTALVSYLTMETVHKNREYYFENNSETSFSDVVAYKKRYEAEYERAESLSAQLAESRKNADKYRSAAEAKPVTKSFDEKAYQSELAMLQKQNRELLERAEKAEANNRELFALREFAFAVDNGVKITDEDATTGEEALNALAKDYRIAIVGGHTNWRKKMMLSHPDIEFFDGDNHSVNLSGLHDVDILVMYTEHMAHTVYEKALVSIGKNTKVCFAGRGVNVDKMERDIANAITEKLASA